MKMRGSNTWLIKSTDSNGHIEMPHILLNSSRYRGTNDQPSFSGIANLIPKFAAKRHQFDLILFEYF